MILESNVELEVGVVGDVHELGEARSTMEGMVDTGEVDDFEGERLLTEVVQLAKGDVEPCKGPRSLRGRVN